MRNNGYVVFKPVSVMNDQFITTGQTSSDFNNRLQKVLVFYKEDFKVDENGNVLISESKWKDKDLMWNYTSKANDLQWLNDHSK